jgi:GT2 family glycosyltransferase
MPKVSIIIRAKNEERWIGRCLRMVFRQDFKDFEVVLVDNNSTDHTVAIAKKFPVKLVTIDRFRPGLAINEGVRASSGELVACLSAHCIPKDARWLSSLLRALSDPSIAGAYGRQLPMSYSSDLDKRDLLITFGLDSRVQVKDSFFHNANSLFRRAAWERIPFDEQATNIEDRIWGEAVIKHGWKLAYEPEASVYHHHGIHQDANQERARNIVRILESLDAGRHEPSKAHELGFLVLLPVLGPIVEIGGENLLERCLKQAAAGGLGAPCVIADDEAALATAKRLGARALKRPAALMAPSVGVEQVLQYGLQACEAGATHYDAVLYANYLFPFRPEGFLDRLTSEFERCGADSLVPVIRDYAPCWKESDDQVVRTDSGFLPRQLRKPLQRGLVGLGTVTSSEFIRQGRLLGDSVALVPIEDKLCASKANDPFDRVVIQLALERGTRFFGGSSCNP